MLVLFILCLEVIFYIDFSGKSDSVRRLNGYDMPSAGEIGQADGEENVRLFMLSMLVLLLIFFIKNYCSVMVALRTCDIMHCRHVWFV